MPGRYSLPHILSPSRGVAFMPYIKFLFLFNLVLCSIYGYYYGFLTL
jgi:hypothetical protein